MKSLQNTYKYHEFGDESDYTLVDKYANWIDSDESLQKIRENSLVIFKTNIVKSDCYEFYNGGRGQADPIDDLIDTQDRLIVSDDLYKKYNEKNQI